MRWVALASLMAVLCAGTDTEVEVDLAAAQLPEGGAKLFEADIMPDRESLQAAYGKEVSDQVLGEGSSRNLAVQAPGSRRWNTYVDGKVQIAYVLSSGFYDSEKVKIRQALDDLESTQVVRFVERTTETDYINVKSDPSGCWSYVGKVGGAQSLNLQPPRNSGSCIVRGIIAHEFLHALGFWHEQSRPDRDDYVNIVFEKIQSGREGNFRKQLASNLVQTGSPYDYNSVMHYHAWSFSVDGSKTIEAPEPIGQRDALSQEDLYQLTMQFMCPSGPRVSEDGNKVSEEDFCNPLCPCWEGKGDCDTDADCRGDLVCVESGAVDVCAAPPATDSPTKAPTSPTPMPTGSPTTKAPTGAPTSPMPTLSPTTGQPSKSPTTKSPTAEPTQLPTSSPVTKSPSSAPSKRPTSAPVTKSPTPSFDCRSKAKNQRKCNRLAQCQWVGHKKRGQCYNKANLPPTPAPTTPECTNVRNRRQCQKTGFCRWNSSARTCFDPSAPTPPPVPFNCNAISSKRSCRKQRRQCTWNNRAKECSAK